MPGGRQDPTDADQHQAAVRETSEEVGVDLLRDGRFLGRIDDQQAVAHGKRLGLTIAPFVYVLEREVTLTPEVSEVQEMHWVPLNALIGPENRTTHPFHWSGVKIRMPAWRYNDRVIWGLTFNMIDRLMRIVATAG